MNSLRLWLLFLFSMLLLFVSARGLSASAFSSDPSLPLNLAVDEKSKPDSPALDINIHLPLVYGRANMVEPGLQTVVLTKTANDLISAISGDGAVITFSSLTTELAQIGAGDVIIGESSLYAPDGFLRKVLIAQDHAGGLVLTTEQATVEQAFKSADVGVLIALTPENINDLAAIPGIHLVESPDMPAEYDFHVQFDNVVLFDQDGNPATTGDRVFVSGLLYFNSSIDFRMKIEDFSLVELYFTQSQEVFSELSFYSEVTASIARIDDIPLSTLLPLGVNKVVIPASVPIPLIFHPEIQPVAGLDGDLYAGLSWHSDQMALAHTSGIHLVNGQFNVLGDYSADFTIAPLAFGAEQASEVLISPNMALKLYGVTGPYVEANLAVQIGQGALPDPNITVQAGVEVPVGIGMEIFSHELVDFQAVAIDERWTIWTWTQENQPPYIPWNPDPVDGALDQPISALLSWSGGDPDADTVTYDVYFENGDATPDVLVSDDQSSTTYDPGGLNYESNYYWQIVANDEHGLSSAGPVWSFSTVAAPPLNQPPFSPNNPSPIDGAAIQPITTSLSWSGGDPDADNVTYDVYFEDWDATPDVLASADQSGAGYDPGGLNFETTYYWQIITSDEHGLSTTGPVWSFTTENAGDIPGMVFVPAGEFSMGCDPDHNGGYVCFANELPLHTVFLDEYYIDITEVTNALYAQCVVAGDCATPASNSSWTHPTYYDNPAFADYPVIYVSWYDATDYCAWSGKRLPTEAEWEKAARGPSARAYPWGDQPPDCTYSNFNNSTCVADTTLVGSYPLGASPYGALDMAGNVLEWVNDWYQVDYYTMSPTSNPPGPITGDYKVLRGGSWFFNEYAVRTAVRSGGYPPTANDFVTGFRCASSSGN